jgi:hypothetical protein
MFVQCDSNARHHVAASETACGNWEQIVDLWRMVNSQRPPEVTRGVLQYPETLGAARASASSQSVDASFDHERRAQRQKPGCFNQETFAGQIRSRRRENYMGLGIRVK